MHLGSCPIFVGQVRNGLSLQRSMGVVWVMQEGVYMELVRKGVGVVVQWLLDVVRVRLHLIQDIHEVNTSRPSYTWRVLCIGNVARGLLSGSGGARHLVG
jgi:hypothetical protein